MCQQNCINAKIKYYISRIQSKSLWLHCGKNHIKCNPADKLLNCANGRAYTQAGVGKPGIYRLIPLDFLSKYSVLQ